MPHDRIGYNTPLAPERGQSNLTLREEVNFLEHLARLVWFEGNIPRFIKFSIVGASGTLVNLGLLYLLVEFGGLNETVAVVISYEISILNNFAWNELWTFRDRRAATGSVRRRCARCKAARWNRPRCRSSSSTG